MHIHVITSCTGQKAVHHANQLTAQDFALGAEHVRQRESELPDSLVAAEDLYTGQQHVRLMRGVRAMREQGHEVDVTIVSAGYGVIQGKRRIAPYDCTFNTMSAAEFRAWAKSLNIAQGVAEALRQSSDQCLILLGDRYLEASAFLQVNEVAAPTLAFCAKGAVSQFPACIDTHPLVQADTTRYGVNMIGLKGEVAARMLEEMVAKKIRFAP